MLCLPSNLRPKGEAVQYVGGSVVERLPLAQGVILGSWDQVPHRAPLPVSLMKKYIKIFFKKSITVTFYKDPLRLSFSTFHGIQLVTKVQAH